MSENRLKEMKYPGRGVVVGVTIDDKVFGATFITGRSEPSKARKYVQNGNIISTEPTDPETLDKGNPDLLLYNAIAYYGGAGILALSNGKQTDSIMTGTLCGNMTLKDCTRQWNYEPDKLATPRINGRISIPKGCPGFAIAELGAILQDEDGSTLRAEYPVMIMTETQRGCAAVITTYAGGYDDVKSYREKPFFVAVKGNSAEDICAEFSEMLDQNLIVGVATAVISKKGVPEYKIMNFRM